MIQKQPSGHEFIIDPQLLPADISKVEVFLSLCDSLSKLKFFLGIQMPCFCYGNGIIEKNRRLFSITHTFFSIAHIFIAQNQLASTYLTARVREARSAVFNNFLQGMKKLNIIVPFQIHLLVFNSNEWVGTDAWTLRRIRSLDNKTRINIAVLNATTFRDTIMCH